MSRIKVKRISESKFDKLESDSFVNPIKPSLFWTKLAAFLSFFYLKRYHFKYKNNVPKDIYKQPCVILMNHCYETDFDVAFYMLRAIKFNTVAAENAFIGRKKLLQKLGCYSIFTYDHSPVDN